jgi:glycine oxidase
MAPKADGILLVGGIMEKAGYDPHPTVAGVRQLAEWLARVCPELSGAHVREVWAGLRPGIADLWPVMGAVPGWKGVYVCAGHYRNGVLMSPFTGRYMANGLADGVWDSLGKSFLPDRFLSAPKAGL